MIRVLAAVAVLLMFAQEPSRVLRIDVIAVDRNGDPITDLDRDDLEIWINGYRIPIESIRAVTSTSGSREARLTVLLLDDVTVVPQMLPRVKEAARRFVTRMRPDDRMAVALLSGGLMELTADPARLLKRIDSFNQTGGFLPIDRIGAQMLTVVAGLSREMREAPERRKTIVGIGSGWLFDTPIPPPHVGAEVRREWLDAVRAMAVTDVTFYVIDPAGVGAGRSSSGDSGFARDTGGHAFINTNDFNGAVDRILRETENYYEIHVVDPPFGTKSPIRELDVRSLRRGVTVRARRGIPGAAGGQD